MNWDEVCRHPALQDLPFKIELNEWGQVLMSPASNRHGRNQMSIGSRLTALKRDGEIIAECSIQTTAGVRVADVAWASDEFIERHGFETPYPSAPELCVEVVSPSNSPAEIREKTRLYLAAGAREVWFCLEDGRVTFHAAGGRLAASGLFPGFPAAI